MSRKSIYPRSSDRGLIEATSRDSQRQPRQSYPRSSDRGLIEASDKAGDVPRQQARYPRSSDRGLIEAGNGPGAS